MQWLLDSLLEHKEDKTPAIITREKTLSYAQLWHCSECIARDILSFHRDTPIVIYGDKNYNIIPTMIAALKTGHAYVPVDITFPLERLQLIAKTADACVIYNYSGTKIDLPFPVRELEEVESFYDAPVQEDLPSSRWVKDQDNCYILFTSGSTGVPKGVPICKSNIMNMMDFRLLYPLEGVRNIVLQMSFSFDASVQVIYPYMSMGCTIVCVDKGLIGDSEALVNWLIQCQAHLACFTPSFLDICRKSDRFNQENLPGFKQIYFGGEILLKKTVQYLHETFPKALVYNLYGPTESTVDISGCLVTDEMLADEENPIPIGYKMDGTEVWIEAEDGRHCADGEVGELVTVSKSVSRGYFNNPEKTKACFFMGDHGLMGYRTGDLVYRKNELLYFVGRKDFQIKLNGYRIEVEDVTSNLSKVSVVQSCAVLPALGKDGKVAYLAGFVTLISGIEKKSTLEQVVAIKSELKELIPAYMIPQKIFIVPEFKLNTNNKIDRKALAEAYHITLA